VWRKNSMLRSKIDSVANEGRFFVLPFQSLLVETLKKFKQMRTNKGNIDTMTTTIDMLSICLPMFRYGKQYLHPDFDSLFISPSNNVSSTVDL